MKLFISYKSDDREIVKQLIEDLRDVGHEVWYDQDATGGQTWWDRILEHIRWCDAFIAALTPGWLASDACQREIDYAVAINRHRLPVIIASVGDYQLLPRKVQQVNFVNYINPNKESLRTLIKALNNLGPVAPLPDPLPTPPEPPISPLADIAEQLTARSLSFEQQVVIFFRLWRMSKEPTTAKGAAQLMERLRTRRDLMKDVNDAIGDVMSEVQPPVVEARLAHPIASSPKQSSVAQEAPPLPASVSGKMDVVLTNARGVDANTLMNLLISRFALTDLAAQSIVSALPQVVLSNVDSETATKAAAALKEVGAQASIERREYQVRLMQVGTSKIDVIKVVRQVTPLGLTEAKTLVEKAPVYIFAEYAGKTFAENAARLLKDVGATATIQQAKP